MVITVASVCERSTKSDIRSYSSRFKHCSKSPHEKLTKYEIRLSWSSAQNLSSLDQCEVGSDFAQKQSPGL